MNDLPPDFLHARHTEIEEEDEFPREEIVDEVLIEDIAARKKIVSASVAQISNLAAL